MSFGRCTQTSLHFLLITRCLKAQRHEFRPNVVAMAERILITVWMISFQVSLFFIIVKDPLCPLWGIWLPSRRGLRSPRCDTDWHLVNPLKVLFAPSMGGLFWRVLLISLFLVCWFWGLVMSCWTRFSICPRRRVSDGSRWDPETSSGWHDAWS